MIRKAFRMSVAPAHAAEYERRHNPIWTELEATLRRHGVHRYSIFLDSETGDLFALAEVDSDEHWESIAATDVCRRWWRYMAEIMPVNTDGSPRTRELREVFRLGGLGSESFGLQNNGGEMTPEVDPQNRISRALDALHIELPSWGFADTGTRFGKFVQPAAAATIEEKIADAAEVHRVTGCCPTLAVHVLWDFPDGVASVERVRHLADRAGIRIGSINPNLFEDQQYKHGSLANPDKAIRRQAIAHVRDCVAIARRTGSRDVVIWLADGSNYPGTAHIRRRRRWLEEALQEIHEHLAPDQRLLVEYKPFEPAFYHTDIADWGMALLLARAAGPQARVLVDTGHHYPSQNVEQIVAWLLEDEMLGGFHFNDRRYADDDLTLGSIDPYQVFRIFHEIALFESERSAAAPLAYMIDQSHNLKGKIEAMIQTVQIAQELAAKAALVDHDRLRTLQDQTALVDAEETLRRAFLTDVLPSVRAWRRARGLPEDPLGAFRESGYLVRITRERSGRPKSASSYA